MARNGKTPPSAEHSSPPAPRTIRRGPESAAVPLEAARSWMNQSLQAARSGAEWFDQLHRIGMETSTAWIQTLATAMRDIERADSMESLLSVPAQLVNRQLELSTWRFGESVKQLLEAEMQWADQARKQAAEVASQMMPSTDSAGAMPNGADNPVLEEWSRAQEQWLQMTQRWIDSAAAQARH